MSESMWVRSHVRQLLQEVWDAGLVELDADGDVPFRCGTAACWVSVLDTDPIMVRVFAHAAHGLRDSSRLLHELNDLERRSLSARVEFVGGVALVSQTISPIGLTAPVLVQALDAVGGLAERAGGLLAAMFDGLTPFPALIDLDEEAS